MTNLFFRGPMLDSIKNSYPLVYKYFCSLEGGEEHLRQIQELDRYWENIRERSCPTVVLDGGELPSGAAISGDYDLLYVGGTLGILHAAVMAEKYGWKVLLLDKHVAGKSTRDWNISREELHVLYEIGLFSEEEIEECIACRYKTGWAEFFVENGNQKRLYLDNVLDCAVNADQLLGKARKKILFNSANRVFDRTLFRKIYRFPDYVVVEAEDQNQDLFYYKARAFVDVMGIMSPVAMQLNDGCPQTHVCPTVGTIATGLENVDQEVGEILVSTEPADLSSGSGRQLIWEGFPAGGEKYITYLFFYDSVDSDNDKTLLGLFETYFRKLPDYKKPGPEFSIERPVFGIIPAYFHDGFTRTRVIADDHILMLGDAATLGSPLTFCGFGSLVRNLSRLTGNLHESLKVNSLDRVSLEAISAYEPNVATMANLMKYMCFNGKTDKPNFVNELMNEVMLVLDGLPVRYRKAMFRDSMQLGELLTVGIHVALKYPEVLMATPAKLGLNGSLGMIKNMVGWALSPTE